MPPTAESPLIQTWASVPLWLLGPLVVVVNRMSFATLGFSSRALDLEMHTWEPLTFMGQNNKRATR